MLITQPFFDWDLYPAVIVRYDFSNRGTMDSDTVGSVDDLGPNGYDVTQTTAGNKPSYTAALLNGRGGVQFDGGDWLDSATFSPTYANADDFTVFSVVKFDNAASGNNEFWIDATQGTDRLFCLKSTDDELVYWLGGTMGTLSAPSGAFISTVVLNQDSWGSTCWQKGTLREVGNTGTGHDFVDIRIGAHNSDALGLDGDLYYLVVVEGILTTDQINVIGRHLGRYFGISWTDTLPAFAQSFDGTDDYFENSSFSHITDYPVSIGAWCRRDLSGTRSFFSLNDPATNVDYINCQIQNASRVIWAQRRVTGGSGNTNAVGTVNFLTYPEWHLVVIVCTSATSCTLYVDSVDAVLDTTSVAFMDFTKLSVGRFGGSSPGQYARGSVDSLFVSDQTLTATDVSNIRNGTGPSDGTAGRSFQDLQDNYSSTYNKLTNAYHLDESSGNAVDLIGSKDLTRGGAPTQVQGFIPQAP